MNGKKVRKPIRAALSMSEIANSSRKPKLVERLRGWDVLGICDAGSVVGAGAWTWALAAAACARRSVRVALDLSMLSVAVMGFSTAASVR
jgi:hypothetical protein